MKSKMTRKKILVIENCEACCLCIFDDDSIAERYGKYWCTAVDREVNEMGIPKFCPLPTAQKNIKTTMELIKQGLSQ